MRSRRWSFVAGWAAVALLAVAGFAAFGTPEADPEQLQAEAAAASIGHTAGAYAGLAFAQLGSDGDSTVLLATAAEDGAEETIDDVVATTEADNSDESTGTIVSPTSGWLSEVEVRALVSAHFEPTDVNKAVRLAWCQSRFDPNHTDLATGGIGLFSHLPRYWEQRATNAGFRGVEPTDPEASTAAAAWEIYNGSGWEVFNCS